MVATKYCSWRLFLFLKGEQSFIIGLWTDLSYRHRIDPLIDSILHGFLSKIFLVAIFISLFHLLTYHFLSICENLFAREEQSPRTIL
jgi:hypothetical protein